MDIHTEIKEWFNRYVDDLYSFLSYYCGSLDVDDLVQETFLRAMAKMDLYKGQASPKTWLCSIARNVAKDSFRKQRSHPATVEASVLMQVPSSEMSPERLAQATSYVFKFVNPPWGKTDPNAMETWGNDIAYEAMYLAPDGSGKGFTIMETKTDTSTPPKLGAPWKELQTNSTVFYQNTIPGTTSTALAMVNNGVKSSTSSATGVYVQTYGGKDNSPEGRLTLTYERGKTQLKILEAVGVKYINPNVAGAPNGVKIHLKDGENAVYIDGGEGITMIDGGSANRRAIAWTTKAGVNITIVASQDLNKGDLLGVANSLQQLK